MGGRQQCDEWISSVDRRCTVNWSSFWSGVLATVGLPSFVGGIWMHDPFFILPGVAGLFLSYGLGFETGDRL